jgi:class 3 adenylate cyclase/tetratricopeptide (TPR) repeat protein
MIKCPGCSEENPPKFRLCGYCGTPLAGAAPAPPALPVREMRKTVTLIFSDLKDSTALGERLDNEALHEVKDRYFVAMAAEIQRHGGKIEKYIGDAIMAVFGLPKAHEDDALRAVRAADGMRRALVRVNEDLDQRYGVTLGNRTGVNTGEVVANDDEKADQKLATGDAVNVAARLEQAAPVNEIYLGETTFRLVRDAVEVEAVEPLQLKGKTEKVPAYRLVSARGIDGYARRQDTPIVGRDAEIAALHAAYDEARHGPGVRLVTVIGDAGLGKSRLVREVTDRIAAGARVLHGRCLPYGEGITFWPLVGMVRQAAKVSDDDPPEAARARLLAAVGDAEVADRLASAVGLSTAAFPLHEIYWGARKFFEGMAATQPVVVIVDDIHWAEPALLDLLIHLLDASTGAPILLLATARHDLIDSQPEWAQREGSTRLVLQPLTEAAAAQVVANLLGSTGLPADVVRRIVTAAEGNPLYVEQMLAMLIDTRVLRYEGGQWVRGEGDGEVSVPPTIQALVEARLDGLARADRAALEPAAVIGLEFPHVAVETMAPEAIRPTLGAHLDTLAKKHFIRPAHKEHGELLYRFHHQLVRDTTYNGLLKRNRAGLHLGFVRWADKINADRDRALEFQEILGYHLEQAYRYLKELGPLDANGVAIGTDAAHRLSSAARRAFARGDMHAASNLYRRAIALLDPGSPERLPMLPELGEALMELGEFAEMRDVLDRASAEADRHGNARIRTSARLVAMLARLYSGEPGNWGDEVQSLTTDVIPSLERADAHNELANAWRLVAMTHLVSGRHSPFGQAAERVMQHARLAGNGRLVARSALGMANSALYGPMPVRDAIARCQRLIADRLGDRQVEAMINCKIAQLLAMDRDFDAARALHRRARASLRDLGNGIHTAATGLEYVAVELLAGDLAAAERVAKDDCAELTRMGASFYVSTMAALLSRVVRDLGRDEEAMVYSRTAEQTATEDDVDAQVLWRSARAPILARAGDFPGAEALARSAVEIASRTEIPALQADSRFELAVVLGLAGRREEARVVVGSAIDLYSAKGDRASCDRCNAWAATIAGPAG